MLPLDQVKAEITSAVSPAGVAAPQAKSEQTTPQDNKDPEIKTSQEDLNQLASDGLLINGSVNNGAASPFAQFAAFGNNRSGAKGLYNGGIGMILDNAGLDARPFSLSGQNTPKASYNRVTGVLTLGGPLRIPHLFQHGPNFFVGYQWTRDRDATTQSALLPNLAERDGDFSQALNPVFDPATGLPFPGNTIADTLAVVLEREPPSASFVEFLSVAKRRRESSVQLPNSNHQQQASRCFRITVR